MAIDERDRHALYQRLERALGEEATSTLMSYLPPVGWADVTTKADLANLEHALLATKHEVMAELHRELNTMTRTVVLSVIGTNVSIAGAALALSRLL